MINPDLPTQDLERSEWAALVALTAPDLTASPVPELLGEPDFAEEVAEFEAAAAALAYSVPMAPMAPELKSRLFERIAPVTTAASDQLFELLSLSIAELREQARQLDWEPLPVMAGASIATWTTNPETRNTAFFIRASLPGPFPNHRHAGGEGILVVEGDLEVDGQVYVPGERVDSEPGTSHAPSTPHGCLIFCVASLDNELID